MKHPLVAKEGFSEELDKRVAQIMKYDSDNDGIITFKDFYDNILRKVPSEWL
jgi:Ca2+-binding EF-hand superfamily protein